MMMGHDLLAAMGTSQVVGEALSDAQGCVRKEQDVSFTTGAFTMHFASSSSERQM